MKVLKRSREPVSLGLHGALERRQLRSNDVTMTPGGLAVYALHALHASQADPTPCRRRTARDACRSRPRWRQPTRTRGPVRVQTHSVGTHSRVAPPFGALRLSHLAVGAVSFAMTRRSWLRPSPSSFEPCRPVDAAPPPNEPLLAWRVVMPWVPKPSLEPRPLLLRPPPASGLRVSSVRDPTAVAGGASDISRVAGWVP